MSQPGTMVVPLRRNRPFALFWAAELLSNTGTQVSELAIPLTAVLVLSASPTAMGGLTAMEALPSLVLGLLVGVFVDRVRRGRLLVWASLGQGALMATVPVAAALGLLTLPQLYAVMFLVGSLALAYKLAHTAYIPVLVTDDRQLTTANGSISLSDSVTAVGGPGLAGVLVQLITAPLAVATDAASFLVAALLQRAGLRSDPAPEPDLPRTSTRESVRAGLRAFVRQPGVVALTMAKGIPDFFHWGVLALWVLYAVRELHFSAALIGVILMIGSLGPVLAGVIASPVGRRFGIGWTSVVATVLFGGANLLIPLATGPAWLAIALVTLGQFVGGLGVVYLIIVRATMLQRAVPARLLGRVGGVIQLIEWGPGPVGGIAGGLLGQFLGLRGGLVVLGLGGLLGVPWIAVTAARGRLRAVPGAEPTA